MLTFQSCSENNQVWDSPEATMRKGPDQLCCCTNCVYSARSLCMGPLLDVTQGSTQALRGALHSHVIVT